MSVLACNRASCDNIMCYRYSNNFGYICSDCFEELVQTGSPDIETFMNTPRDRKLKILLEVYQKEFPYRIVN